MKPFLDKIVLFALGIIAALCIVILSFSFWTTFIRKEMPPTVEVTIGNGVTCYSVTGKQGVSCFQRGKK